MISFVTSYSIHGTFFAADVTEIGPVRRVDDLNVFLHQAFRSEFLIADGALHVFALAARLHVTRQLSARVELFAADPALVSPYLVVPLHVVFMVVSSYKAFTTDFAFKFNDACVISLQVVIQ